MRKVVMSTNIVQHCNLQAQHVGHWPQGNAEEESALEGFFGSY